MKIPKFKLMAVIVASILTIGVSVLAAIYGRTHRQTERFELPAQVAKDGMICVEFPKELETLRGQTIWIVFPENIQIGDNVTIELRYEEN